MGSEPEQRIRRTSLRLIPTRKTTYYAADGETEPAERLAVGQNVSVTDPEIDQKRLADLTGELRYLLNQWDPIGVYDEKLDFPPDEYDCLIGPLMTRLARHESRASLGEYLWNEIENHFGLDPVRCGADVFADRLQAWYTAKSHRS
jgi:hypothetical protein